MRRITLPSLLGLSSLLLASIVLSGPSHAQERKKEPARKRAVLVVTPGDESHALSDDDKKKDKAAAEDDKKKPDDRKAEKADPVERARRGVVSIERAGEIVGMGTVLGEDGRILTALSPLSDGNNLAVRYADGTSSRVKVGHSSRLWDMAMLVPQGGKWGEGLAASEVDPMQQKALKSFAPGKGKPQVAALALKGRKTLLGADEQALPGVFEFGNKLGAREVGSPVIDEQGNVVAMVGRACLPVEKGPCLPSPVGMPVPAIRQFLSSAPASAARPAAAAPAAARVAPWLGIRGAAEKGTVSGVRVLGVLPDSPADEAGLKGGADKALSDLIVAVDDAPVGSPEDLAKAIQGKSVGDRAKLLVFRQGKFQENSVLLQPPPAKK